MTDAFESSPAEITIRFEPDQQRSSAWFEGRLIGECTYQVDGNRWLIVHTQVLPAFKGQGIARRLVETLSGEARQRGLEPVPVCSYARHVLG